MLSNMHSIFQRHILLNIVRVHRDCHKVELRPREGTLSYMNRVKQLSSILKSMETAVVDQAVALVVMCELPSSYEGIVTTLDPLSGEYKVFT